MTGTDPGETEQQLRAETEKWGERLEERLEEVKPAAEAGEDGATIVENARAYAEDARHFEEEGDLVRAFEAVVWGWSWLEIGEELGVVERG